MAKKIKGAAKAKSTGKRIVKAKTTARAGFELNVPAAIEKKLTLVAAADSKFKGSNPQRYAMFLIKNAAGQKLVADKT